MANGLLNNILAYYKFDEATSGSDAIDASGNALTLTRTGAPPVGTGLLNGFRHVQASIRFSSADPTLGYGDEDATFLGFFRPQTVTGIQSVMSRYDTTANTRSYSIRVNATTAQFVISNNGTSATVLPFTGLTLAINTWYFACARYTAATDLLEFSVTPVTEGTVRAFQTITFPGGFFAGGATPFAFGCEFVNAVATNVFNGDLDEWGLYVAPLTNTQVSQFYNAGVPLGFPNFDVGGGTPQTLAGSSSAVATASGQLALSNQLAGTSAGVSSNSAALGLGKPLAGSSAGVGSQSAALALGKPLAGASAGLSTNSAALVVQPPGQKMLGGIAAGSSTNAADLSVVTPPKTLAGSSAGSSTNTATLLVSRPVVQKTLEGVSVGRGTSSGTLLVKLGSLAGSSHGSATARGSLSVKRIVAPPVTPPVMGTAGPRSVVNGRQAFLKMSKSNMILPPPIWPKLPKEIVAKFPSLAKPLAEYDEKAKDFFRQVQESQR